jgi:hypothetical protein
MILAILLWLGIGVPASIPYFRRRRLGAGLAVLPMSASLSLLAPWIVSAYTGLCTAGAWWGIESAIFSMLLGVVAELILQGQKSPAVIAKPAFPNRQSAWPVRVVIAGVFLLIVSVWYIGIGDAFTKTIPPFQWDGYATWLLVTRVIADSDFFPRHLFVPGSQWEYPILMPVTLAWFRRVGELGIHQSTLSLAFIAIAFPMATWAGLWRKIGPGWAAAAVSAPLMVPRLIFWHYGAYADGMMVMADVYAMMLAMVGIRDNDRGYLFAGSLGLAVAVATKNEGALWVVACAIGLGLYAMENKATFWQAVKKIACCIAPAIVVFLSWWGVCKMLGLANDVIANASVKNDPNLTVAGRLGMILHYFGLGFTFPASGDGYKSFWQALLSSPMFIYVPALVLIPLLSAGGWLVRLRMTAVLISAPAIYCLGMVFIYLITPKVLEWHLQTSLDRVLMVVFAAMFAVIFFARRPATQQATIADLHRGEKPADRT